MQLFNPNSWEHGAQTALLAIMEVEPWEPTIPNLKFLHNANRHVTLAATALTAMAEAAGGPVYLDGFVLFLAKKQSAYGCENILKYGQQGVEVRLWDKIARLENLAKRNKNPEWETVYDTWSDIVGYCVISIMLENGSFLWPLEENMEEYDVD
jgi:hypothetical protein